MDSTERQRLVVSCRLLGKSVVEELKRVERELLYQWGEVNSAYNDLRSEAILAATVKIDAMLKAEKAEADALYTEYCKATADVLEAKVAESLAKGASVGEEIWSIGTKVQREVMRSYRFQTEFGVVSVCQIGDEFPENIASHHRPRLGEFYVRVLTKDGTPGKRVSTYLREWTLTK